MANRGCPRRETRRADNSRQETTSNFWSRLRQPPETLDPVLLTRLPLSLEMLPILFKGLLTYILQLAHVDIFTVSL